MKKDNFKKLENGKLEVVHRDSFFEDKCKLYKDDSQGLLVIDFAYPCFIDRLVAIVKPIHFILFEYVRDNNLWGYSLLTAFNKYKKEHGIAEELKSQDPKCFVNAWQLFAVKKNNVLAEWILNKDLRTTLVNKNNELIPICYLMDANNEDIVDVFELTEEFKNETDPSKVTHVLKVNVTSKRNNKEV